MSNKDHQRHPAQQQAKTVTDRLLTGVSGSVLYTSPITLEAQAALITGINALDGTVSLTVFPRSVRSPGDSGDPHRCTAQLFGVESVAFTSEKPGTPAARGCWSLRS